MIIKLKTGDKKYFEREVRTEDTAVFEAGAVHPVYATFALARDAEWCGRLFVLEMKEDTEEGIGTFVEVNHISPALIGNKVIFEATIESIRNHEIICSFVARHEERVIARGRTGQKILRKEKLEKILEGLNA
ncbi:MAG: hypothetical protein U0T74_04030 [Chitinophagales bacterium]